MTVEMILERDALKKEVEALRADKERLDWMDRTAAQTLRYTNDQSWEVETSSVLGEGSTLREAIDAAMKAEAE